VIKLLKMSYTVPYIKQLKVQLKPNHEISEKS